MHHEQRMQRVLPRIGLVGLLSVAAIWGCVDKRCEVGTVGSAGQSSTDACSKSSVGTNGGVTWCDVKAVLSVRCWRCHHKDPEHDAPFELCRYADTQREYVPGTLI